MKKKLFAVLICIMIWCSTSLAWATQIQMERPYACTQVNKVFTKGGLTTFGAVSLGVHLDSYHTPSEPLDHWYIGLNVSVLGDSKRGVIYQCDEPQEGVPNWMNEEWEPIFGDRTYITGIGDDWGNWADLPDGFGCLFYGGNYYENPSDSYFSDIWICSNGFVSFDVSESTDNNQDMHTIPEATAPNAIIAPLWTDLKADSLSKIITQWSIAGPGLSFFVVIWKDMIAEGIGRLTFSLAIQCCTDVYGRRALGSQIYMAYQSVQNINSGFTYGIEDPLGKEGTGEYKGGSELGSLQNKYIRFWQNSPHHYIERIILDFEDHGLQGGFWLDGEDDVNGFNIKYKYGSQPETLDHRGEVYKFSKVFLSTANWIASVSNFAYCWATAALPSVVIPLTTLSVGCFLVAWGLYDWYIENEYNNADGWCLSSTDDSFASVGVLAADDTIKDAGLSVGCGWVFNDDLSEDHHLTITAGVEYKNFDTGELDCAETSIDILVKAEGNNNSLETEVEVGQGTYGVNPMLYSGESIDFQDFYLIDLKKLVEGDKIDISLRFSSSDLNLFLLDPGGSEKSRSDSDVSGVWEHIEYELQSTDEVDDYWFIEVRNSGGSAYYNMTIDMKLLRDFNEDDNVNILDSIILANAFGSEPQDPHWNPQVDLIASEEIDILDAIKFANHFGQSIAQGPPIPDCSTSVTVVPAETVVSGAQTFYVNITVTNATDLYAHEFKLYYNNTVINCTNMEIPTGHILEPVDPANLWTVKQEINNTYNATHGRIWLATSLLYPESSKNGNGTLARIAFQALNPGTTNLIMQDVVLGDSQAEAIHTEIINSTVRVNYPPQTPSKPSGPSSGYAGTTYTYSTSTIDPDGDMIRYQFNWGDSQTTTTGWYTSGTTVYASHKWMNTGTYYVKARAQDQYSTWTNWSLSRAVTISDGGGGGGCPTLSSWNGTDYTDHGVIDIHNETGDDVIRNVFVTPADINIHNYKAKFRLTEGWEGLNFSESTIDQVKLYAIDSIGTWHYCPLIKAQHSTQGNVLLKLLLSDDYQCTMTLLETIDLKFFVPYQTSQTQDFVFVIEGCNQIKW